MPKEVIAIFDIGKTNKKFLLFGAGLKLVYQEEQVFEEVTDEDGFACDNPERLEQWMKSCIKQVTGQGEYLIKALNFTTYGASLAYLDDQGRRLTPVYNYLKPMPEGVMKDFYESYGGVEEFCRKTASPELGMLNSGLQILWLKRKKSEVFCKIKDILHLPQYVSYCFTGKIASEYTSIGCHTAIWDFDNRQYHPWLKGEGISLPQPVSNSTVYDVIIGDQPVKTGIGIHDSSASLVPYFNGTREQFILISTGTWCIFMNPFNKEPLTAEQLRRDTLCYMSIQQRQVKSSRLFLGHIHDINLERMSRHFGVGSDFYRTVKTSAEKISRLLKGSRARAFFREGIPADYVDTTVDLSRFLTFNEAYHQLMYDLVDTGMESLSLIIPADDNTRVVYISGGFARNEIFVRLLASRLPDKEVYISEIDNATALGAAMVVYEAAFGTGMPEVELGLKRVNPEYNIL
jgi:sugar (pentulose or hexulose) kinase